MQPEPVSPELVLVDPELALRERARLVERAELEAIKIATLRRAVESQPAPAEDTTPARSEWRDVVQFSRRRLLPAVLMLSLLATGVLAGEVVARYGKQAPSQDRAAVRAVTLDRGSSTYPATPSTFVAPEAAVTSSQRAASTPSGHPGVTKGSVERKLVSLISAPARKLPPQFVDSTTGLIKNNVQVVCRRRTTRSFLCIVRLPSHPANEGLYVRYRSGPNGRDVFKWYGYRFAALTSPTIR